MGPLPLLKKYAPLFRPEFRQAGGAWLLGAAVSLLSLVPAFLQQKIFDVAIPAGDLRALAWALTGLVVSYLVQGGLEVLLSFAEARVTERADFRIKGILCRQLLSLPQNFYEQTSTGEIQKLWDDSGKMTDSFQILAFSTGRAVFSLVCYLPLLLWISPLLTLVKIASFPMTLGLNRWFAPLDSKAEKELWGQSSALGTEFQEGILGIRTVKAFGGEESQARRWKRMLLGLRRTGWQRRMVQALWGILSQVVHQLMGALFFLIAAWGLMEGWLSFGGFLAFSTLAGLGVGALQGLAESWGRLSRNINPASRVDVVLSSPTEAGSFRKELWSPGPVLKGEAEFRQVSFAFGKGPPVLSGVQLHLPAGTKTAVVGPSGSGKSTLVNLLMGFYQPTAGMVLVDGIPLESYRIEDLRSRMGLVLQENFFFHRTLRENLLLGRRISDEEIFEALEKAHALEFVHKIPGRLKAVFGARGINLSGGQKQRLAIARAFLQDPAILILDEATSALDSGSEKAVQAALEELCSARTSLVIAHRLSTVLDARNICFLAGGTVSGQGSHLQLMDTCPGYRNLWAAQGDRL